jgi:DNA-binding transcriptional ArsR family regulator
MKPATQGVNGSAPKSEPMDGFVKRTYELIEELARSRAILAAAEAKRAELDAEINEARASVKELSAQLLEVINGPKKPKSPKAADAGGARPKWPLAPTAFTRSKILFELDSLGTATTAEIADAIGKGKQPVYQALIKCRDAGMVELLDNGQWGLTAAQQKLMRESHAA